MCDNLLDNDIILIELPRDPNNVPWEVPDINLYFSSHGEFFDSRARLLTYMTFMTFMTIVVSFVKIFTSILLEGQIFWKSKCDRWKSLNRSQ